MLTRPRRAPIFALLFAVTGAASLMTTQAAAADNDLKLSRLADRQPVDANGAPTTEDQAIGFNALPDMEAFRKLTLDMGLVFAPKFLDPAETLGEAGFDVGFAVSYSTVDTTAAHWRAREGGDPTGFVTGQFHVRKGLPFSFEFAGKLTHLFDSSLVAVGTDLKWALNESFLYLPDFAVRGSVNNVVGNSDLNLTNAGFDLSLSYGFGVAGVVNITPYAGYNRLWIISSSRLLDVAPEDPTQPVIETCPDDDPSCVEGLRFQPEFVFGQQVQIVDRGFVGSRFIFGYATLTFEAAFTGPVKNYSGSVGFDF